MYCLSKHIIRLTQDVFLVSLLFRIVSILNHIHLHLFMFNNVNVTLLRNCFRLEMILTNNDITTARVNHIISSDSQ